MTSVARQDRQPSPTGLSADDLQAPAKNLDPVDHAACGTRCRGWTRLYPGDAARWRTISSIAGSGYDAMGWVPEGQRSASMSYQAVLRIAPYLNARRGRHGDIRS